MKIDENIIKDLPGEIWLPVVGYEGEYEISNLGRIKSLPKIKYYFGYKKLRPTKLMSLNSLDTSGYRQIRLTFGDKRKMKLIHRLVAQAFIPTIKTDVEVNHIDTNKLNNNVNNLEWLTRQEHAVHTNNNFSIKRATGENHWKSKITDVIVIEIKRLYSSGECKSYAEIGRKFNLERHHAGIIIKGKNWKHIS